MPKYTNDDVRKLMDQPALCRNIVFLGAKGDGKSTLVDNLGVKPGYLSEAKIGESLFTLYRADEREKKTNIKSNLCHIVHEAEAQKISVEKNKVVVAEEKTKENYLFTVMDAPGHVEYGPEVAASLRICDTSVISVSANDGVSVGLEYVISDSLKERVKPLVFVNKLDISMITLKKDSEEIYQDLEKVVTNMNVALASTERLGLQSWNVDPQAGNVIFGSSFYGWAFSLRQMAERVAEKTKKPVDELLNRMWGDQFFNPATKKWAAGDGEGRKRGFCMMIMDPIVALHKACMNEDDAAAGMAMVEKMGIQLKPDQKKLAGKALIKVAMCSYLSCGDALARMIATHGNDPNQGAKLKIEQIYKMAEMDEDEEEESEQYKVNNKNSQLVQAMIGSNKDGPVMFQGVKMMPTGSAGRFYVIGRCFSGTITTDKYHCRAPEFDFEDPETAAYSQDGRVQLVSLFFGKEVVAIQSCPAGMICGLSGVDQVIEKSATITGVKRANNFANLHFNVSAILRIAIKPKDNKQLPKLVEGLKRLKKSDILVNCTSEASGDHIVAGCGQEHLKTLLKDLKEEHACVDFSEGVPTVSYKETCSSASFKEALSKSPNKHNRLYVIAVPMEEECIMDIENRVITMQQEAKKRARLLIDNHGWEKAECMKIWGFGPNDIDEGGANILVDQTKGIQYLNEIKDSCLSGLQWAAKAGPLAEENMRGCRFNLMDVKLHADSIHRGLGQIQPTARRVFYGAVLTGDPRFLEPIYKCVIACPEDVEPGVNQALLGKRGEVQFTEDKDNKKVITALLPIAETLGSDPFSMVLQTKTSGKAFATYEMDRWALISTNPLEKGSKAEKIMFDIRERKGLKVEHPDVSEYLDRL